MDKRRVPGGCVHMCVGRSVREGRKVGGACAGHCVPCKSSCQYRNLSLQPQCTSGKQVNFSKSILQDDNKADSQEKLRKH